MVLISWAVGPGWILPSLQDESQGESCKLNLSKCLRTAVSLKVFW